MCWNAFLQSKFICRQSLHILFIVHGLSCILFSVTTQQCVRIWCIGAWCSIIIPQMSCGKYNIFHIPKYKNLGSFCSHPYFVILSCKKLMHMFFSSGWVDPWSSATGCCCNRQFSASVWSRVPESGTQTQTTDAAALQRVYQTGKVIQTTGCTDQHIHSSALCSQGELSERKHWGWRALGGRGFVGSWELEGFTLSHLFSWQETVDFALFHFRHWQKQRLVLVI